MRNYETAFDVNNIVNRGISGDYTEGVLGRLNEVIYYKPIAVFLLIGLNDFFDDMLLILGKFSIVVVGRPISL